MNSRKLDCDIDPTDPAAVCGQPRLVHAQTTCGLPGGAADEGPGQGGEGPQAGTRNHALHPCTFPEAPPPTPTPPFTLALSCAAPVWRFSFRVSIRLADFCSAQLYNFFLSMDSIHPSMAFLC